MPLTRFAMHAKGEQIHVAAWPEVGDPICTASARATTRSKAVASRSASWAHDCGLSIFQTTSSSAEAMGATDDFVDREQTGGSCVFAPDGTIVADSVAGEEMIVYADIDLGRIPEEQAALDVVGHYNRPDVFSLTVDERPLEAMSTISGS